MTFDKQAYQKQYYAARKVEFNERVRARRRLYSRITTELKSFTPCADCGIQYPYYVMDFDHLPQYTKVREVSDFGSISSVEKLLEEIDKCEIVCSNCHRIRTYTRPEL